jgi:hypothetical protein
VNFTLKETINNILKNHNIDLCNFWHKFIFTYMIIAFSAVLYYMTIFPIVLDLQQTKQTQYRETEIMREIHSIYRDETVIYFNMFPIIGGDRIFVVKSLESDNVDLIDSIKKNNWGVNPKNNMFYIEKNDYMGCLRNTDDNSILILGCIETDWGELWYKLYELYFLNLRF